ncbi:hypothetical protein WT83_11750 [Burkholderia territorii]|uniref:Uncharacterized protein n=1 Tax=Burkholderia territorii TaxID=1503055 RepID=A0A108EVI8_9BURK|nr:hypothetical protein WT83_11750 [Burkholderia territorii]
MCILRSFSTLLIMEYLIYLDMENESRMETIKIEESVAIVLDAVFLVCQTKIFRTILIFHILAAI